MRAMTDHGPLYQRLVSRIDWKVTAWACIGFFALDLPRSNMNQANTDNFLDDLGLNTNGQWFALKLGISY